MNSRIKTLIYAISLALQWPSLTQAQSSQFENYLNQQNGTVAYPLSNFVNQYRTNTKTTDADGFFPPQVSMTFSRSLQKNNTTVAQPRELATLLDHDSPQLGPSIPSTFIGHTSQNGQLEAISWNKQTRQYDFFQVNNYEDQKTPNVIRSNRAVCMSCHQGGGPIFPAGPWSESSFNTANSAASLNAKLNNLQNYLKKELDKRGKVVPSQILQMNVPNSDRDPNALANFIPNTLSKMGEILKANGITNVDSLLSPNKGAVSDFIGLPADFAIEFDDKIRLANDRLIANNVCKNLCSHSDKACIASVERMMAMSALVELKSINPKLEPKIVKKRKILRQRRLF